MVHNIQNTASSFNKWAFNLRLKVYLDMGFFNKWGISFHRTLPTYWMLFGLLIFEHCRYADHSFVWWLGHSETTTYTQSQQDLRIGNLGNCSSTTTTIYIVMSSWPQGHSKSSFGSFDECRTAPSGSQPQTKPNDWGCESACFRQLSLTNTIAIYYAPPRGH